LSTPAGGRDRSVLVWPLWLRLLHWTLAFSVIASFLTHEGGGVSHERWGWLALVLAALRVLAGLFSHNPHVRFAGWVRSPAAAWRHARAEWQGRAPRTLGHNPLGGWMMLVLLADTLLCGFTGWLYTTDRFWGVAWVEELHGALGEAFVPLVVLHVAGAAWVSWRHRENLVGAMLHGRKRPPGTGDLP
jgi:cytochrome b